MMIMCCKTFPGIELLVSFGFGLLLFKYREIYLFLHVPWQSVFFPTSFMCLFWFSNFQKNFLAGTCFYLPCFPMAFLFLILVSFSLGIPSYLELVFLVIDPATILLKVLNLLTCSWSLKYAFGLISFSFP